MEPENNNQQEKKGFIYWFINVFWYHYKWVFIGGLFAVLIFIFLIFDAATKETFDFHMIIGCESRDFAESQVEEIRQVVAQAVGDLDGDGKANVDIRIVHGNGAEDLQLAFLYLNDEDTTLFIMDDPMFQRYSPMEFFDPVGNYGFETDDATGLRIQVNELPLLERAGFKDTKMYMMLADWTVVGKGSPEALDATIRAYSAILSAE